jgi:hypothetical protein
MRCRERWWYLSSSKSGLNVRVRRHFRTDGLARAVGSGSSLVPRDFGQPALQKGLLDRVLAECEGALVGHARLIQPICASQKIGPGSME